MPDFVTIEIWAPGVWPNSGAYDELWIRNSCMASTDTRPKTCAHLPAVAWYRQEKHIAVNRARMRDQSLQRLSVSATTLLLVPLRPRKMRSLHSESNVCEGSPANDQIYQLVSERVISVYPAKSTANPLRRFGSFRHTGCSPHCCS